MVDDDQMIPTQFGGKWWRNVEFPHLHTGAIYSLVYSADRSFLLSAGEDRTVQLVNPQTSLIITSFKGFHSHGMLLLLLFILHLFFFLKKINF